jgi:hypothetical protein
VAAVSPAQIVRRYGRSAAGLACQGSVNYAELGIIVLDVDNLALGFRLGTGREVLADALAVQPTGHAVCGLPGGIGEFRNDERRCLLHERFATSTGKSVIGFA